MHGRNLDANYTLLASDLSQLSDSMGTLVLSFLWANRPKPKIFSTVCCVEPKDKKIHRTLFGKLLYPWSCASCRFFVCHTFYFMVIYVCRYSSCTWVAWCIHISTMYLYGYISHHTYLCLDRFTSSLPCSLPSLSASNSQNPQAALLGSKLWGSGGGFNGEVLQLIEVGIP